MGESAVTGDTFSHAFLWKDGSIHDLGGSLGGDFTGAISLNAKAEAVGYAYFAGDTTFHAVLWRQVGKMTDLGTLGNDPGSYSNSINAEGQIVGSSMSDCNGDKATFHPFLWENGSLLSLNALIPPDSTVNLTSIYTINDRGEIAGGGHDSSGNDHAFLLIPCDENHPGVEGCDYSLVGADTETRANLASDIQIASSADRSKSVPQSRRPRGFCQVSELNNTLTGSCVVPAPPPHPIGCVKFVSDPAQCRPGAPAIKTVFAVCGMQYFREDQARPCAAAD